MPPPGVTSRTWARLRVPQTVAAMLHEAALLLRDPALLTWSLFVFLIPFYVLPSGLPQPGDLLVIPLVPLALRTWNGRLDRSARRPVTVLLWFTLWVLVVDWGWALWQGNFGLVGHDTFLLFPVYYVYNALVFLVVCVLYKRHGPRFLWLTLNLVLLSVVVQTAASFLLHRGHGARGIGFFNNPNQLGFFALVSASIIALSIVPGRHRLGFGPLKTGIGLTVCLYLALASASRAAVIGSGLLIALAVIPSPRRLVVVGLVIAGLVSVGGPVSRAIDDTQQRLSEERHPELNFFEERGYDRILAHKEYWLLGAGEGGTTRFAETTRIGATEIHSSAGTIFFSYGIVGVLLILVFLIRVGEGAPWRSIAILLPTLSYTIAHQGLRVTSVWILFGVFVCCKHLARSAPVPRAVAAGVTASGAAPEVSAA